MSKNKKIKILYFHHGGSEGGAPRSLSFLINNLDKNVYEPYVLCCMDYEGNKEIFEAVGAKVIYDDNMGPWHGSTVSGMSFGMLKSNIKKSLPTYFNMFKILEHVKPNIVHLNSTCLFLAAKAVKKYNKDIPIVCHVREPLLNNFWGDILRKNINKYADSFVAIERYDAESLHTSKPIKIVYNFVDFKTYNSKVKSNCLHEELKIPEKEKIILYLARISSENGAYEMLNSLETYIASNKNVHFCLVGAQFDIKTEYLSKVVEMANKYDNIHLMPFRKDVPNIIASSDILVAPFIEPHFARSVIEAAAMGVPSIVSNVGGLKELVVDNETGLIYDQNNKNDLCNKIEMLLNDANLLSKMGKNSQKYAHENFDAKINSKRTFEVYNDLLG